MKGSEIRSLIEKGDTFLLFHFDGIFACDSLISIKKQHHFVIINTAKQNHEGIHWVLALRFNEVLEYFDPLGTHISVNDNDSDDKDNDDNDDDKNVNGASTATAVTTSDAAYNNQVFANGSLLEGINTLIVSEKQYQPTHSENCGLFCIYLAHHRLLRLDQPFSHVLSKVFTDDQKNNDERVRRFAEDLRTQHARGRS